MTSEQSSTNVLLSVRPNFAGMLLDGSKTAELRRCQTRIVPGTLALLYASSPQRALVGAVRIETLHTLAPSTVWERWGARTGLSRSEFNDYVEGCDVVTALLLDAAVPFSAPIPLASLRLRWDRFIVPQSYRYLDTQEINAVLNGESALLRELRRRQTSPVVQ